MKELEEDIMNHINDFFKNVDDYINEIDCSEVSMNTATFRIAEFLMRWVRILKENITHDLSKHKNKIKRMEDALKGIIHRSPF